MYRNHQGLLRPTDVKKARAVAQKAEEQRRMTIGRITFIKKTHCLFLNFMVEMPGTGWVGWDGMGWEEICAGSLQGRRAWGGKKR